MNCFISNKYTCFSFHSSKSLPVKFQQKNSRGEHRQSRDWANKQQWTSQIRSKQICLRTKTTSIASKFILQKTEVTHHSIPSINTPIKALYNPIITHPEERIWAGRTPRRTPRAPDAPKIKHDKMKQFYIIDMGRKMWYYHFIKKVRIPLVREGKISLAMKNQTIQRMKIELAEGWQTRGT